MERKETKRSKRTGLHDNGSLAFKEQNKLKGKKKYGGIDRRNIQTSRYHLMAL